MRNLMTSWTQDSLEKSGRLTFGGQTIQFHQHLAVALRVGISNKFCIQDKKIKLEYVLSLIFLKNGEILYFIHQT